MQLGGKSNTVDGLGYVKRGYAGGKGRFFENDPYLLAAWVFKFENDPYLLPHPVFKILIITIHRMIQR